MHLESVFLFAQNAAVVSSLDFEFSVSVLILSDLSNSLLRQVLVSCLGFVSISISYLQFRHFQESDS